MMVPRNDTLAEQALSIRSGHTSSRDLVQSCLNQIDRRGRTINAFTQVLHDQALSEADERDRQVASGRPTGALHGVPIAVKDDIAVAGVPTGHGRIAGTAAPVDAEAIRRLRACGAIIIGKTTMSEFALWPFTETRSYGYTLNPWHRGYSVGGSSGGSAAAVAAGLVAGALGGDGGGSIRIPAAHCGVLGLKTSRHAVDPWPRTSLWRSLGVLGPLTRTARDAAIMFDALTNQRNGVEQNSTSCTEAIAAPSPRLRIGVSLQSPMSDVDLNPEVARAVLSTAETLADLGHDVVQINPHYPRVLPGFVPQMLGGLLDAVEEERAEDLDRKTRLLVVAARAAAATRADRCAEKYSRRVSDALNDAVFGAVDLILTPTTYRPAPAIGQLDNSSIRSALGKAAPWGTYTTLWNLCGNPAAALPVGLTPKGLPLSAQLIGPHHTESLILCVAHQLEQTDKWLHRTAMDWLLAQEKRASQLCPDGPCIGTPPC
ncbi:amidase [Mycobacterium sp. 852002-30065_SCH5024008]|uniref:amidase n=1 Tax=Mycobacterium sp. 852002-30065_SCH5024008 TaxID=1834088 RepID=UPI0008017908|nr:amidase family protein [Mycobacterium sp. 852002-30065_SCH5024008]OBB89533.1 hypothetical protein A5781_03420 [Mycobacterium sp. 852002-30065_SCH5024008]